MSPSSTCFLNYERVPTGYEMIGEQGAGQGLAPWRVLPIASHCIGSHRMARRAPTRFLIRLGRQLSGSREDVKAGRLAWLARRQALIINTQGGACQSGRHSRVFPPGRPGGKETGRGKLQGVDARGRRTSRRRRRWWRRRWTDEG